MISVQIVTWNSGASIATCLESLARQERCEYEVVVVDNASSDPSADVVATWLGKGLPGTLVRSDTNLGFCGGQNRAFRESRGEWVLFLNPDAWLPDGFLRRAAAVVDRVPDDVGSIAPRLLLPDGRVDSAGLVLDGLRRVYDLGRGEPMDARFSTEREVLGGSGAAVLHRRSMLAELDEGDGPLDPLLFAYYDDLDVAWRARLMGWRCLYVPELVARHERGARNALRGVGDRDPSPRAQALTVRNRILVMAKCDTAGALLRKLPVLVGFEMARIVFLALRSPGALRGYAWAVRDLPRALRSRRWIRTRAGAEPPAPPSRPLRSAPVTSGGTEDR